ncbi:hypothetical protein RLIN73S_02189 [Rhodanobacter lindaniclasticus]
MAHSGADADDFVRALIDGGFADLRHPEYWDLAWGRAFALGLEYRQMVAAIGDSLHFMETRPVPSPASPRWISSPRTRRCCSD